MRFLSVLVVLAVAGCGGDDASPPTSPPSTAPAETAVSISAPATSAAVSTAITAAPASTANSDTAGGTGSVGYIGCSMTRGAVRGYHALGGTRIWPDYDTAGAAIAAWADPASEYWTLFDERFAEMPPTELWVQVCVFRSGHHFEHLVAAVEIARERCPDCAIRIGWQPEYEEGWECRILGSDGLAKARDIAQRGVEAGLGAPDLSPMGPLGDGTVDPQDGCHANEAGQRILGEQLLDYYG